MVTLGPEAGLEASSLLEDQLLQGLFGQVVQLHLKLKGGLSYRLQGQQQHSRHQIKTGFTPSPFPKTIAALLVAVQLPVINQGAKWLQRLATRLLQKRKPRHLFESNIS